LVTGAEKKYNLRAPSGEYEISVESTQGNLFTGNAVLTGRAVGVGGSGLGVFESYPIVWIFLALILLIAGIIVFIKYKNRTVDYTKRSKKREEPVTLEKLSSQTHEKRQFLDLAKPLVEEAESSLSMKGTKDYCSIVSINIKNKAKLGGNTQNIINEIITQEKGDFGVVDNRGDHILIIYSPLMTKTFKNELIATKASIGIKEKIDAYNKKFNDKISYNIGINGGDMISSTSGGKLSYTSLGNSIVFAKRISDLSEAKVLVSEKIRQKLLRETKVNRFEHKLGDMTIYEILRIADTEANQDKLRDLLKRTSFS
jgi:class 3 adenylate cyclase